MNLYYSTKVQSGIAVLDETESYHCAKVLRQKAGDNVWVVDGQGGFYEGRIGISDPKACTIIIEKSETEYGKRSFHLHIAMAPTKNIERFEWFLEKATEIGIDEITPVICRHSERKVIRHDRLEKVITSAMKQSQKAYHPVLHPLIPFNEFIRKEFRGQKFIAHCMDGEKLDLIRCDTSTSDFIILIGPEGDFSDDEVKISLTVGFNPVSLGNSRLRTETAGLVACQIISDVMALKK